jgi:hypothetical protein
MGLQIRQTATIRYRGCFGCRGNFIILAWCTFRAVDNKNITSNDLRGSIPDTLPGEWQLLDVGLTSSLTLTKNPAEQGGDSNLEHVLCAGVGGGAGRQSHRWREWIQERMCVNTYTHEKF